MLEDRAFSAILPRCKSEEEVFSFPITSYPLSIAKPNGGIYQGDKTTFRDCLIGKQHNDNQYLYDAAWIFDAGYVLQQIKPEETYRDFCRAVLTWMVTTCKDARPSSIVIVVEDYRTYSIKETDREIKGIECKSGRVIVAEIEEHMPQGDKWIKFLMNNDNKHDFLSLFACYLNEKEAKRICNDIPLIFRL